MIHRLFARIIARRACNMAEADIERICIVVREEVGPRLDVELAARLTAMGATPSMRHLPEHPPNPACCHCRGYQLHLGNDGYVLYVGAHS